MVQEVDLKKGVFQKHLNRAEKAIRDGYIIVIPLENSYAYACDAFREESVRAMHVLRRDELGVMAQVLAANIKTVEGIVRDITPDISALMKKFWPGMLSMNLRPQLGLTWNLGDNGDLDLVCVRVPRAKFAKALLAKTGPLAIASATFTGQPPIRAIKEIQATDSDIAVKFSAGTLRKGDRTSLIEVESAGLRVIRVGSISVDDVRDVVPDVMRTAFGSL